MPAPHGGPSRSRGMAILAAAALVAVAMSAMPAMSAKKPLTKKKAMNLFYPRSDADAKFLDQSEGDARYLDQTEGDARYLDQTEGDARYHRQGNVVISHNGQWSTNEAFLPAVLTDDVSSVEVQANGAGNVGAILHLLAPVNLGMRTYGLQSVSVCYALTSGGGNPDKIDTTEVWEQAPGTAPNPINDTMDRLSTTGDCYSVSPASPYTPTSQGSLILQLLYLADHADDALNIYGIRTTWVSTGAAGA